MRSLYGALSGALLVAVLAACSGVPTPTSGSVAASTAPSPPPAGAPNPNGITIPKIGAHSTLIPTGNNPDGTPQVPPLDQPMQASWFEPGPEPGENGPSTIYGHVNGNHKEGIFARLSELAAGDEVDIARVDGSTAVFTVTGKIQAPKNNFPVAQVYKPSNVPELRLVTCGGTLLHTAAGGTYADNIVVSATLARIVSP